MPEKDRDIVIVQMMKGFNDLAKQAGTRVTGGQTTMNAWYAVVYSTQHVFIH